MLAGETAGLCNSCAIDRKTGSGGIVPRGLSIACSGLTGNCTVGIVFCLTRGDEDQPSSFCGEINENPDLLDELERRTTEGEDGDLLAIRGDSFARLFNEGDC